MRISDWSSDVCSSDLSDIGACRTAALDNALPPPLLKELPPAAAGVCGRRKMGERSSDHCQRRPAEQDFRGGIPVPDPARHIEQDDTFGCQFGERSEEHTSELQSLMRISYAVFCLKKKKKKE